MLDAKREGIQGGVSKKIIRRLRQASPRGCLTTRGKWEDWRASFQRGDMDLKVSRSRMFPLPPRPSSAKVADPPLL